MVVMSLHITMLSLNKVIIYPAKYYIAILNKHFFYYFDYIFAYESETCVTLFYKWHIPY